MTSGILPRRYAKALLAIAVDVSQTEAFGTQLQGFAELFARDRDLRLALDNPSYSRQRRGAIVSAICDRLSCDAHVRHFLMLLLENNRIAIVDDIAREYSGLADEHLGRARGRVTSAKEISSSDLGQLKDTLETRLNKTLLLTTHVEPDLIAGNMVQLGSVVYDGSLRGRLDRLRAALMRGRS